MKITYAVLAVVVGVFSAIAQEKHAPLAEGERHEACEESTVDTAEFNKLAEQWRQAYNSKDAKNLAPLYANDAEYISSHVAGYIAHGRDAVIANFQKGIDGGGTLRALDILSFTVSCEIVAIVTRYRGTAGGHEVDGRNLLVWKKIHDQWLIVRHMTVVRE